MAFFGLVIETEEAEDEIQADAFDVWPENVETVAVFVGMETQWACVATAKRMLAIGLRYESLREMWQACGVKRKRRAEVMRGLRVMELAALPLLNGRGGE